MSRAAGDIRPVFVDDTNEEIAWNIIVKLQHLPDHLRYYGEIITTSLQFVAIVSIVLFVFIFFGRMLLRRSRIAHYSRGK